MNQKQESLLINNNCYMIHRTYFTTKEFPFILPVYELRVDYGAFCGDYGTSGKKVGDIFVENMEIISPNEFFIEGYIEGKEPRELVWGIFEDDRCWGGYIFRNKELKKSA